MEGQRFIHAAYAYLFIGDYEQAKAAFERAVEADPDNPEPYFYASITAHRSGCYEEARRLAQTAVRLNPVDPLYQAHLRTICASECVAQGKLAYIQGDTRTALQCYQRALQTDPLHQEAQQQLDELVQIHPELQ